MEYVRRENYKRKDVEEVIDPDGIKGIGHDEENHAGEFFPPKFLVIRSTRSASCKDVLCQGLKS